MTFAMFILAAVTLQRGGELLLAHANARRLMRAGAKEWGKGHYPAIVLLHASWLAALWLWGWSAQVNFWLAGAYGLLQALRFWILFTLGRRWTTRVITVPGEKLVSRGPYRFFRHPNYLLVLLEVPLLPLALGLPRLAAIFGILNALMLTWRVRVEDRALSQLRGARK